MTLLNLLIVTLISWFISILIVTVALPLHSILLLIGLFTLIGICFIVIFNLAFIGTILIIVYVGAVAVLFIFVIMIIPQRIQQSSTEEVYQTRLVVITVVFGLIALIAVCFYLMPDSISLIYELVMDTGVEVELIEVQSNALSLSLALYYEHPLSLILAALLLFVAIAAAILICRIPDEQNNN